MTATNLHPENIKAQPASMLQNSQTSLFTSNKEATPHFVPNQTNAKKIIENQFQDLSKLTELTICIC